MKIFFDYLFYRIYWWNTKVIKQKESPFFYTIAGVSAFYIINNTTIIISIYLLFNKSISHYPKLIQIAIMIFILCYCYYYYMHKRDREEIITYFKSLDPKKIKRLNFWLIIYIILTIISHIGIIIIGRKME